ncbi:DUF1439 domain-containing protein [Marinobacter salexigens]|uniref:DUF1439 domain-containing protein n=1 Tax=Marinobacter salexigens TaxID=1925763 RepID=UPI000C281C1C|nr:DUF1439 domain-containing protein [Marinobacter salexigens]
MKQQHLKSLWALMIMVLALTTGCASMSPYSISEGELERHLQKAVSDYDRQQLQNGSPLSMSLSGADVTLGPDGRDVAVIDVKGQVALNAILTKLPVDIALKVEGAPVYDSKEKAIFIRRIKLLESSIDAGFFKGDLAPVTDTVMGVVAQMLETMPVYRLNESNMAERMFGLVPMDVRVAPGRLEFVMDDK